MCDALLLCLECQRGCVGLAIKGTVPPRLTELLLSAGKRSKLAVSISFTFGTGSLFTGIDSALVTNFRVDECECVLLSSLPNDFSFLFSITNSGSFFTACFALLLMNHQKNTNVITSMAATGATIAGMRILVVVEGLSAAAELVAADVFVAVFDAVELIVEAVADCVAREENSAASVTVSIRCVVRTLVPSAPV